MKTPLCLLLLSATVWAAPCSKKLDGERLEEISEIAGQSQTLRFQVGSRILELKGSMALELERRLILPPFPFRMSHNLGAFDMQKRAEARNIEDVVAYTLDSFYACSKRSQLKLKPMGEASSSFHHRHFDEIPAPSIKAGSDPFLTTLSGQTFVGKGDNNDSWRYSYVVGKQLEHSLYFDSADDSLAQQKIAVRIKSWFPHATGYSAKPAARRLFLKRTLPSSAEALFTEREEWQFLLPDNMNDEELQAAIRALLHKAGAQEISSEILPKIEIYNTRYGVDLTWDNKKIGFVTYDRFHGHAQLEIEIFPEHKKLLRNNELSFQTFLDFLASDIQAAVSSTPKYQLMK